VNGIGNFKKFCDRSGIDFDSLVASMGNSGAVISGSFALQCLTGESFSNSDIDLYVNASANQLKLKEKIAQLGFENTQNAPMIPPPGQYSYLEDIILSKFLLSVSDFSKTVVEDGTPDVNLSLQIIETKIDPLDVTNIFDFTICQVTIYVEKNVDSEEFRPRFRALALRDISEKVICLSDTYGDALAILSAGTLSGGYFVSSREDGDRHIYNSSYLKRIDCLYERLGKYVSRGFSIRNGIIPLPRDVIIGKKQAKGKAEKTGITILHVLCNSSCFEISKKLAMIDDALALYPRHAYVKDHRSFAPIHIALLCVSRVNEGLIVSHLEKHAYLRNPDGEALIYDMLTAARLLEWDRKLKDIFFCVSKYDSTWNEPLSGFFESEDAFDCGTNAAFYAGLSLDKSMEIAKTHSFVRAMEFLKSTIFGTD